MPSDILLHIPLFRPAKPLIDCAVSLAGQFGAHLDGVAFDYQPLGIMASPGGDVAVLTAPSEVSLAQAKAAIDQFEEAARRAGISYSSEILDSTLGPAGGILAQTARLYDLTIVGQPDSSAPTCDDMLPEAVLFGSGRPILLVPYIHRGPLKIDNAMICWDGSRTAARAVHDSLPFLRMADKIEVVTVDEAKTMQDAVSAAALTAHLDRHNLQARIERLTSAEISVHNAILSYAADRNIDFIVMGGYGHSQLREFILGGVTRGIFESLTVPALMAH
jgi:nucleotide-binding universal stress UspA family protein